MENYRKAPKLYHVGKKTLRGEQFTSIPNDILEIIFNNLQGKCGNEIKLMILLIGTIGDGSFGVSEAWLASVTGMSKQAYGTARRSLVKKGWLIHKKGYLAVDFNAIRNTPIKSEEMLDTENIIDETQTYIDSFLIPNEEFLDFSENLSIIEEVIKSKNVNLKTIYSYIRKMKYSDFLKTTYWKFVSYKKKSISKFKCQVCNSSKNLNVHHKTYVHHGEEIFYIESDLVCLCENCHKLYHSSDELSED